MQGLLEPHYDATLRRCRSQPVILAAQDSTSLNYTAHPATDDLGPLNTRADRSQGLWMHDTLALTPDGVPLGLLDVQCWARDPAQHGKAAQRTRRMTQDHGALWDFMQAQPVAGVQALSVPRRATAQARTAQLQVRHAQVELKAPQRKAHLPPANLWVVSACEAPAAGLAKPIEWMLLTTVPVDTFEQACECLAWYARRWEIEVYHRTLKSGCQIQNRQLGQAKRLKACLAIDLVVAWRVFHLTQLAREQPDVQRTCG
ncbi:hypothetical protein RM530_18065 [Algiphilus sp. W345]|uniref:Transposase n=1 Tax=Banduia mediterranea TaxID=3075609 RepID=A0ABU2WN10_9GAMM|nr:hypothetical protein [Algiphilus sp. W345]MDT0499250.1 hypothetical protein [Algiphilus sp. W345]